MSPVLPGDISLFRWADQLPPGLWEDLADRPPEQAAEATGASWRDGVFSIDFFGAGYQVDPRARTITELRRPEHRVSYQTGVVLVTTLSRALPVEPSGNMATPHELPGGSLFFTGPHAIVVDSIIERYGDDPQAMIESAKALGGEAVEAADVAVKLPALPKVDFYVLLWAADEEFTARAVVALDDRVVHHLALDGVFALVNVGIHRLAAQNHG